MRGQKSKKILYHIGPRPAAPKPKMSSIIDWEQYDRDRAAGQQDPRLVKFADRAWVRHWLDSPVESGVFLTPSPVDVSRNHGRSGNVYAYRVPGWVIDRSGGIHRYDSGSEILIPEDVWNEAGREIEFLGKSMSRDQLRDKIDPSQYGGPSQRRGQPRRPSWLSPEEMRDWDEDRRQKGMRSFILGLRKTDHKEDLIKLFTQEERVKALEAFESLYPSEMAGQNIPQKWRKKPGERRGEPLFWAPPRNTPSVTDAQIIRLLKKHIEGHIDEALLREYVIKILSDSPHGNWRRLLNEEVVGNLVFGYTEMSSKDFENFKNQGFKLRAHRGPLGRGLYSRYKYRGDSPSSAEDDSYGNVIVKFKVSLADKIPILQYEDSKIAYPSGYRLTDQLINFGILSREEVSMVDNLFSQLPPEDLKPVIDKLTRRESGNIFKSIDVSVMDASGLQGQMQDDTFKIILLSRLVDAINNDIPKSAPYVRNIIGNIKGGGFTTDSIGQQLIRTRKLGSNVAGIMTYVGEGSIDGYVLFLNTPKLAIPVSYFAFDEGGFKELGLKPLEGGLSDLRRIGRDEKRYRIMTKEGDKWVWNLGLGKEAVFSWLDVAGLVMDGKVTLEKLSDARIWDDKLSKVYGGGKRGGYISGPGGIPRAQRLGDMDRYMQWLDAIITSGTKVIPKPEFKKFPKEAMRSWIRGASRRREEISPEKRAKEQQIPDLGFGIDMPPGPVKTIPDESFYVSEMKSLFEGWRRYLLAEAAMGPPELPDGVIVVIERSFDGFWVHYAPANFPESPESPEHESPRKTSPAGEVEVSWISDDEAHGTGPYGGIGIGECGGAGIVTDSWVSPKGEGWGKILYDVAMEHATLNGGGLVSDRGHVSPAARGMWMRYLKMSGGDAGITKHQLKKFDTSGESPIDKDDCLQHSSTYDPGAGGLPKNIDWIDSALSKRYTKEPTTIDLLKSMGKFVDLT